jgi:iron complex transport system ATP-binding protein
LALLSVENLTTGYEKDPIVSEVSFTIPSGCLFGILGPNGAGKTTLFKALSKVLKPWEGRICYEEKDISILGRREFARKVSVVPQFHGVLPPYTVEEFVRLGRYPHLRRFAALQSDDCSIVTETLALLDITRYAAKKITTLSGGEIQRVYLAQALVQKPRLLLMDEPTSHLDITHQIKILDLVNSLSEKQGLTVAIILHDLNLASAYCDQITLMKDGKIFAKGAPGEVLTGEHIEKVYGTRVYIKNDPVVSKPHIFFIPGQFG